MAGSQVTVVANQIDKQRYGYQAVSLTHPADATAPEIAAGSKHESGGALYEYGTDETITGLAGIANSSQIYIRTTVSGSSITASGTITAPTWDTAKQGWYIGSDRCLGGLYKDGSGNYTLKWLYEDAQINSIRRYLDGNTGIVATLLLSPISDFWIIGVLAGSVVVLAADADGYTTSGSYAKVKEILCPFAGTVRVNFDLESLGSLSTAWGRIYKNGAAVGTERSVPVASGWVNYQEDLAFAGGDLIQIYCHGDVGNQAHCRNFRLMLTASLPPVIGRILAVSMVIIP